MTVGEKIQFYRKRIGLSQEELGQKMFVSRQTVSLWEMDKTLPTVDNLRRLKELFSVSIDDILSEAEPIEEEVIKPGEAYVFQYNKTDLQEVFKKVRLPLIKNAVIFSVACIFLLVLAFAQDENNTIVGLFFGCFLIGLISHVKGYFAYKKAWNAAGRRMMESTYSYEVFNGYFLLNISRNGEIIRTLKSYFDDIEKIQPFGKYLMMQISGQSFILKKEDLDANSVFLAFCNRIPTKVEPPKPKKVLKTVSVLLFVLSLLTIWGALFGVALLSGMNHADTENMWVFFLFTPIPIASVLFGFYLKKKGYKYKSNVIVGFIMAAFLCIYGSFSFIFANVYSHSDEPILKMEELLNIDIPMHSRINTQDLTKGTQSMPRGYVYTTSDIYFEDAAVEEFEKNIPMDTKWIANIPNDMVGITSYYCDVYAGDYYIIYNKDTKEFNKLPSEGGTYMFINVLYNKERNAMKLVEYEIEYTK